MAKLSKKEFAQMKRRALTCLRHLAVGYDIEPFMTEGGCIKICKGYEQIESYEAPDRVINGKVVKVSVITVRGSGTVCENICRGDAEFLQNKINVLKNLVDEIMKSDPSAFDKEKIKEAYFAVQDIQMYLNKLSPFIDS